jgi:transcription-repair coupling factor (superfamily II helicase)
VLTLTATPIPRTLYMSLTGVRDISTIDTPPEERLPVATYVGEVDDHLIRQAILRELDRGGQVYFVHNRVLGIEQIEKRLKAVVPEARIGVGHGQMNEHDLERVMIQFVNREIDVLLCTSIIESGLDIPNANTLIVDRSDYFGLAQLYQLRGRVGRGAMRAYAYFLYDPHSPLSEDARRRLDAGRSARSVSTCIPGCCSAQLPRCARCAMEQNRRPRRSAASRWICPSKLFCLKSMCPTIRFGCSCIGVWATWRR